MSKAYKHILTYSVFSILFVGLLTFQNCGNYKAKPGARTSASLDSSLHSSLEISSLNKITTSSATAISAEQQALDLYKRLVGMTPSLSDSTYTQMVSQIKSGNRRNAAELATSLKEFYQITVRDFAGKMSTREANTLAPMSDFVATVIGVTRDDTPATDLLTGNFYYRVNGVSGVSDDVLNDIVMSNKHYEQIDKLAVNLVTELKREDGQKIRTEGGSIAVLSDSAGLLTTRAFMMAHANQGTNRRIVEYIFKMFLCSEINEWASTTNPDDHVGRDVGRTPVAEYNNKCKGCHTGMDGMRPATAHFDYLMQDDVANKGYLKYNYTFATDPDPSDSTKTIPVPADQQQVPSKFRRGTTIYPLGYVVRNDDWINYASPTTFGWNTPTTGSGINELGQMIAYSDGFKRCMVKRVFNSVCKYSLTSADSALINKLADDFKYKGYKLKDLFIDIALRPECLGVE